ncbi:MULTISPECIES: NAD-dependent epimerase/dehydratase family protein [Sphingobacterium]|uniref:NAD-dependent epimerase/dehydratase family protein n=1 Tax=Sphingobacterium TaxID=28453 RepID=UPI00257F475A|nr:MULTISPECIES: NAD-dependent epimerase/dehydratase family protein [Sphingobacterium]
MKAIIIGASGQIGYAFYQLLNKGGWEVVLLSRGEIPYTIDEDMTTVIHFDKKDKALFRKMMSAGADLVIDLIAFGREDAKQLLTHQKDYSSLIVLSSSSVYRDKDGRTLDEAAMNGFPDFDKPISEANPTVEAGEQTYSTRKVALEQELLSELTIPLTILRPCAIYGAHSHHPREWWLVKRMLDQRPFIPLAYNGQSIFHTTSAELIAKVGLAARHLAQQQIINVGDSRPLSVFELADVIAEYLEYKGVLLPMDMQAGALDHVGLTPWSIPRYFILDTKRSEEILAFQSLMISDYSSSIGQYLFYLLSMYEDKKWEYLFPQLAAYPYEQFDYEVEDAYINKRERLYRGR